jgi:uncharacterized membrane protein YebE (DUF533 family)
LRLIKIKGGEMKNSPSGYNVAAIVVLSAIAIGGATTMIFAQSAGGRLMWTAITAIAVIAIGFTAGKAVNNRKQGDPHD